VGLFVFMVFTIIWRGCRCRDLMLVEFTSTCDNQCLLTLRFWVRTPVSSINITDYHDVKYCWKWR